MKGTESLDPMRCVLHFDMPLNEIITDFYDKIKNMTSGYVQLCLTLYDPMDCSMLGLPVSQHFPKFAQGHVHCPKPCPGVIQVRRPPSETPRQLLCSHPCMIPSPKSGQDLRLVSTKCDKGNGMYVIIFV